MDYDIILLIIYFGEIEIMDIVSVLLEPVILIISAFFLFFIMSVIYSYSKTEKNLKAVFNFLKQLSKKELSYRYQELDDFMMSNQYTMTNWEDLKKALIFPEKFYSATQYAKSGTNYAPEIYLAVDSSFFFNEETLIHSNINYKFIQIMPTLLTGLGPFFTFLKMAIAFSGLDLTSANVGESLNGLIENIQLAALCSVFAVGYSLLFMFFEKILYNRKCKRYYLLIQKEFIRLFDVCTSEQFLLDLVKESKIQGQNSEKILKSLPEGIAQAISKSMNEITVPYLENILYSLNKVNESLDNGGKSGDVVDKLF